MVGVILTVLEKLIEDAFVCPCNQPYNITIFILYGVVPSTGCFICAWCYMDLSSNTKDEGTKNIFNGNQANVSALPSPQTEGGETGCCKRRLYSILTALIWLCLFFLDGRYMACGASDWDGVYAKNETLGLIKWCKPTGNETSALESQTKTLKWMCISQVSSELNTPTCFYLIKTHQNVILHLPI